MPTASPKAAGKRPPPPCKAPALPLYPSAGVAIAKLPQLSILAQAFKVRLNHEGTVPPGAACLLTGAAG